MHDRHDAGLEFPAGTIGIDAIAKADHSDSVIVDELLQDRGDFSYRTPSRDK